MADRPSGYPAPWRRAMELFFEQKYGPDDVLSHEWLYEAFGIEQPQAETPNWRAEQSRYAYMTQLALFQKNMLRLHQIDIMENVRGIGYLVLHPGKQVAAAEAASRNAFRKALVKQTDRLLNIDYVKLDHRQRREHADAMARLGFLKAMYRDKLNQRPGPDPDDDDEGPEDGEPVA